MCNIVLANKKDRFSLAIDKLYLKYKRKKKHPSNSRYCVGSALVKFLILIEFNYYSKLFIFDKNVPMHVMFVFAAEKETCGHKGYNIRFCLFT